MSEAQAVASSHTGRVASARMHRTSSDATTSSAVTFSLPKGPGPRQADSLRAAAFASADADAGVVVDDGNDDDDEADDDGRSGDDAGIEAAFEAAGS